MRALVPALALIAAAPLQAEAPQRIRSALDPIAETVFLGQVCAPFGYAVDKDGLDAWSRASSAEAVSAEPSFTAAAAEAEIERMVGAKFRRILAGYWDEAVRGNRPAAEFDDRLFRFVKTYRKRCAKLAASTELGQFFIPPEQEPEPFVVIERMKQAFRSARA